MEKLKPSAKQELYTPEQVAKLGVLPWKSSRQIRRLIAGGIIQATRVPGLKRETARFLIAGDEIRRMIKQLAKSSQNESKN